MDLPDHQDGPRCHLFVKKTVKRNPKRLEDLDRHLQMWSQFLVASHLLVHPPEPEDGCILMLETLELLTYREA